MHNVSLFRKFMNGTTHITVSTGRSYTWHNVIQSRRPQTIGRIYDMMYALTYKVVLHTKRCRGATRASRFVVSTSYSTYPRTPKLRRFSKRAGIKSIRVHRIGTRSTGSRTPAQKWIVDPNDKPFMGPLHQGDEGPRRSYIPLVSSTSPAKIVDTIDQIDLHLYISTKYEVND